MSTHKTNPLSRTLKTFFGRDTSILREALKAIQPAELGVIVSGLSEREQLQVLNLLEAQKLSRVLWEVSPHMRRRLLGRMPFDNLTKLVAVMESDEAVDIIQLLDRRRRERMLEALKRHDPKKILPLLGFEEKTAGGLMKSEYLRAESGKSVEEVRKAIAAANSGTQKSSTVYVVDPQNVLVGAISLMRLATAAADSRIDDLAHGPAAKLPVGMSQDEVTQRFSDLDAVELPVVDGRGKLLGVVTADDMLDVLRESLSEDLSRFSGTSEDEHVSDPAWLSIRRRLPWLLVNLATAVLAASVVAQFRDTISQIVILAALMPIVAGMGGNAVTQTLGVSIRALALHQLHTWDMWKIAIRQMLVGAANGFLTGTVMAGLVYLWTRDLQLSIVMVVAMTMTLFIAGLGGILIPVTMKKLKIDPALASTVFTTTLTDVVGFFTFLGLAKILLT
ncbi:MAG: magnesium transporter [Patescibacteria group bacterium]|nr:MAG: magnesium transporter [Patescibacteria group bacterium]